MKRPIFTFESIKNLLIDSSIIIGVAALITVSGGLLWISLLEIPDLSSFSDRRVLQSTKIYDRTGEVLLFDLNEDVRRTIVPMEEISYHIKNATVAVEDDNFYNHPGIDVRGIMRAAIMNLSEGDLLGGQGGSTITQQVIKNALLDNDKKLTRKIKEAILAIKIERQLSKEEILYYYLNESPYGGTIYGVEEAAQSFFGKSARDVTLLEAAHLAALPQAPTRLSPYGNNRDLLDRRVDHVLDKMRELEFITEEAYQEALTAKVDFQPQSVSGIRAPHFVMYVKEQLVEMYGEEALFERGFRVITTLDWGLQQQAEEIVKAKAFENEERFNASNAGLVAVDPQVGDILVMVGSRDYFDEEIEGNFNVTLANRQPGSSIKPLVYAAAFTKGYTPETVVYDVKTQFSTACEPDNTTSETPCYSPGNYNGLFKGPVSFRNALAQSLNIPAVKALYLAGLRDTIRVTSDLGITTLNDPDRLGLTLVLGGGEVKLLEHTGAYGVFANEGVRADRRTILRIEESPGQVVDEFPVVSNQVLSRDVAVSISDILSDNVARTPLWGANSLVNFTGQDVAAKSGSTNNLRDAWIMGYTPNIAVGVWVGNNNNDAMGGGLSGLIATPMWREFMDVILTTRDQESFPEPPEIDATLKPILRGETVDTAALIRSIQTSSTTLNIQSVTDQMHSILHFVDRSDPRGPAPTNPNQDGQYRYWEYGVQRWKQSEYRALLSAPQSQPDTTDETEPEQTPDEEIPTTPEDRTSNRELNN